MKVSFACLLEKRFLVVLVICLSFMLRSGYYFLVPYYVGHDVGTYVANSLFYADHYSEIPQIIMRFGGIPATDYPDLPMSSWASLPIPDDPLFYMLSASLLRSGFSVTQFLSLVIPLVSTLILVSFYLVVKNIYSEKAGLTALTFLAISPFQFVLMRDLYASLFGTLFLMFAIYFYFIREREKRFPFLTAILVTMLFISSFFVSIFFTFTVAVYLLLFDRSKKSVARIVFVVIFTVALSSLITQTFYPASACERWLGYAIRMGHERQFYSDPVSVYVKVFVRFALLMLPFMLIVVLKLVKPRQRDNVAFSLCFSSMILCFTFISVFIATSAFESLFRSLAFLEYAFFMLAFSSMSEYDELFVVYWLLFAITSFSLISRWTVPEAVNEVTWNYYKVKVGGSNMPSPYHGTDVLGWIVANGFFTTFCFMFQRVWRAIKK